MGDRAENLYDMDVLKETTSSVETAQYDHKIMKRYATSVGMIQAKRNA